MLEQLKALLWKDLTIDARRLSELSVMAVFTSVVAVVTSSITRLGVDIEVAILSLILLAIFVSVFTAFSSFMREFERGTLDALRVAPVSPYVVYISKLIYTLMLTTSSLIGYLALVSFFASTPVVFEPRLLLSSILLSIYSSSVSSLASAMLVYSEARSILLPVIVAALLLPFAQSIVDAVSVGGLNQLLMLSVGALAFTMLSVWLSRYLLEAL